MRARHWLLIFMVYVCLCILLLSQCISKYLRWSRWHLVDVDDDEDDVAFLTKKGNHLSWGNAVIGVLHWHLLANKSKGQVAHSCPPVCPNMRSFGPSVSSHLIPTRRRNYNFSTSLSARLFCHLCHPTTRQGTPLWASAGHARAIHSRALKLKHSLPHWVPKL